MFALITVSHKLTTKVLQTKNIYNTSDAETHVIITKTNTVFYVYIAPL